MKKQLILAIAILAAMVPTIANAHAQFVSHHHSAVDFWSSLVPEALMIVLFVTGVWRLFRRSKKAGADVGK